jgi:hypothetical protein
MNGGGTRSWAVSTGSTSTPFSGPNKDNTTGLGGYIYASGSGITGDTFIIITGCYDISGLTNPAVEWFMHAWGQYLSRLIVEVDTGGGAWTTIFAPTETTGEEWRFYSLPLASPTGTVRFRFSYTHTTNSQGSTTGRADAAFDDFAVRDATPGDWQPNSPVVSLDMDGMTGTSWLPARSREDIRACPGTPLAPPTPVEVNFRTLTPGAAYDVLIAATGIVPALTGPGLVLPGSGDRLNIDLAANWFFLSTGGPATTPFIAPNNGIPGASGVAWSASFAPGPNSQIAMQAYATNPASPNGFSLSQACALEVTSTVGAPILEIPREDGTPYSLDLVGGPNCFTSAGMTFYGTTYTRIQVYPDGTISWDPTDVYVIGDPTIARAQTRVPRAGWWTDLDPREGGKIVVSSPAPETVLIEWRDVNYQSGGLPNSFSILLDANQSSISLLGLDGIVPNAHPIASQVTNQWLGMSPGALGMATFPGLTTFTVGGSGSASGADMICDFIATPATPLIVPSLNSTLTGIQFLLNANGNYVWTGF